MRRVTLNVSQSMSVIGWTKLFEYLGSQCEAHNIRSVAGTCVGDDRIISYSFGDDSNLSGFIRKVVEFSSTAKLSLS